MGVVFGGVGVFGVFCGGLGCFGVVWGVCIKRSFLCSHINYIGKTQPL